MAARGFGDRSKRRHERLLARWLLFILGTGLFALGASAIHAAEPVKSGLQPGQRPGPYTAVVANGKERGQSYCYICETAERPAVVVFARSLSDPLARLLGKLDQALADPRRPELRAWVTFLHEDQPTFDPQVAQWAHQNAFRKLPLAIFEDSIGPISYRLSRDADVTVVLFVQQKVVANFAYRAGELSDEQIGDIVNGMAKLQ